MSMFRKLKGFLRDFADIHHHARTGRPPERLRRKQQPVAYANKVDGWLNTTIDITTKRY